MSFETAEELHAAKVLEATDWFFRAAETMDRNGWTLSGQNTVEDRRAVGVYRINEVPEAEFRVIYDPDDHDMVTWPRQIAEWLERLEVYEAKKKGLSA